MSEEKTISPEVAFTIISTLREQIEIQKMRIRKLKQKKQQREELLKECRGLFNRSTIDGEEPNNGEFIMILTKIDEVLK